MAVTVTGRITETGGFAVPVGTEVRMAYYPTSTLTTIAYIYTTTIADGVYNFSTPQATIGYGNTRKITIRAGLGALATTSTTVYGPFGSISSGTGTNIQTSLALTGINLVLTRFTTYNITGRVTDNTGVGVSGVTITISQRDPALPVPTGFTNFTKTTVTNSTGNYTLAAGADMPAAMYNYGITAVKTGYVTQRLDLIRLSSSLTGKNFTNFSNLTHVIIFFTDSWTNTSVSASIVVTNTDTGVVYPFPPTTPDSYGASGDIPPGNYTYVITKTNYVNGVGGFSISGGSTSFDFTVILQLNKARIYGYVTGDGGTGLNGVNVNVSSTLDNITQVTYTNSVSGNPGYYEILMTSGGDNTAVISKLGYSTKTTSLGILTAGNYTFNLSLGDLGRGNLVGTVLDNYNLPIFNAAVTGVDLLQTSHTFSTVTNDTTGYYQALPIEGTYSVTLSPDVYKYTPTTLINIIVPSSLEIGATCSFLEMTPYVGQLAGMVTDDTGAPLHNANVYLSGLKTNSAPAIGNTITGSYLIPYLLPISGSYINATYPNHYYASYGPIELYKATTMELPALELHRYVGVVIGKVTDTLSGNNITDASLYTSFDPSNIFYNNITGQEYTYSSPSHLPIGTHTIYVNPPAEYFGLGTYQHFSFDTIHTVNTVNFDITKTERGKICGHIYERFADTQILVGLGGTPAVVTCQLHDKVDFVDIPIGPLLSVVTNMTDDIGYYEFTDLQPTLSVNRYYKISISYKGYRLTLYTEVPPTPSTTLRLTSGEIKTVDYTMSAFSSGSFGNSIIITVKSALGRAVYSKITIAGLVFIPSPGYNSVTITYVPPGTFDLKVEHNPDLGDKLFYDNLSTITIPNTDPYPLEFEIVMQPIIDIDKYYKVWTLTNKIDLT